MSIIPPKPKAPTPNWENIPKRLQEIPQWLLWCYELKGSKWTKVPKTHTRGAGSSTDPQTWCSYAEAVSAYLDEGFDGIGFVLRDGDGIAGTDLDDCDLEAAKPLLLDTYTEISPSGNGVRQILLGSKPKGAKCKASNPVPNVKALEVYDQGRFLTITGARVEGFPSEPQGADEALHALCSTYLAPSEKSRATVDMKGWEPVINDDAVIEAMQRSAAWAGIGPLWHGESIDDPSSADLALCNHLKFWAANNPRQIDSLFRRSELMRPKWDNPHRSDGATYGQMTIEKALDEPGDVWAKNQPADALPEATLDLSMFSLRGHSTEMEEKMLDDKFILGRIAILGQSTVIYAKPNAGKTLLTLWLLVEAIKSGDLIGDDVYYVNADDNHKGLTHKLKIAEQNGFHMLAPGYNGFKPQLLGSYLRALVKQETASGKVLILDTVKKFTDLMDKKKGSDFGDVVRQFVSHGGSVVMLAHVNKHRDEEGKVIHAGTADLVDDADCAYTLDIIEQDPATGERTVMFENFKSRGDVDAEAVYKYDASQGMHYFDRLDSVQAVSDNEREQAEARRAARAKAEKNRDAVDAIRECLRDGITLQTDLVAAAAERSGIGRMKIRRALKDHTGADELLAQYWTVEIRDKNAHHYKPNFVFGFSLGTPPLKTEKLEKLKSTAGEED